MQVEEDQSILISSVSPLTSWNFKAVANDIICHSIPFSFSEFERDVEEIRRAVNVKLLEIWRQLQSSPNNNNMSAFIDIGSTWRTGSRSDPIVATLKTVFTPFVLFRATYSLRLAMFRVSMHCATMLKHKNAGRHAPRDPSLSLSAHPIYNRQFG